MSIDQIVSKCSELKNQHVVLTGGEPMLFDPIEDLIKTLQSKNHFITIETAGTIFRNLPGSFMSISPKPAHSAPPTDTPGNWHERHEATRFQPEAIRKLISSHDYQFKFVVKPEEPGSTEEILSMLTAIDCSIPPEKIFLMPEGRDQSTLNQRLKLLIPICHKTGFRLAPRLQIDLFGDTRGT